MTESPRRPERPAGASDEELFAAFREGDEGVSWVRELRKLPEEEQVAWRNLWAAVERVFSEAKKHP